MSYFFNLKGTFDIQYDLDNICSIHFKVVLFVLCVSVLLAGHFANILCNG